MNGNFIATYTLWFSSDTAIISHEKKYSVIICNNRVFKVTPQSKSFSLVVYLAGMAETGR